ncbi:DUF4871 domain-containing protein [Paenibacillus sp. 1011MAR3C5]|uniref:DUF4871 domain-containing protein n=1 Tax=Paenibacillus sp. 1011MAR3C5 TaxID=1675787 RepID=UPI000E6B760F|nr:DUF4871 domain-containing protein [Paenibacillus sp. 1011MAR3C5]RJE87602.1 DUF4871 domain-containing protein [Paenibacillus sp. 1011MAR3C5]
MMDSRNGNWEAGLKESPFYHTHFTNDLKSKVRQGVRGETNRRKRTFPAAMLASIAIMGMALFFIADHLSLWQTEGEVPQARHAYYDNGKLIVEVFPDPGLKAGAPFGYIFHFAAPFSDLLGKELSIEAAHLPSGQSLTVVEPAIVEEPSSGYAGLDRWTASFALPLGGMWRYEISLDGEYYADVVLDVAEPDWSLTPTFSGETYKLRGIPDVIGFIDSGFIANRYNKYMWFFLDRTMAQEGNFEVKAVQKGSDKLLSIFQYGSAGDYYRLPPSMKLPSSMKLPEPGKWRLLPYMNGKLIGSIVVDVKENE